MKDQTEQKRRLLEIKTERIKMKRKEREIETGPLAAATHINRGFRSVFLSLLY